MRSPLARTASLATVLAAIFATFAFVAPAFADGSSQGYGDGGRMARYVPIVRQYNASRERFRIQGECKSACMLFLGIRNVCLERSAVLRFHGGA